MPAAMRGTWFAVEQMKDSRHSSGSWRIRRRPGARAMGPASAGIGGDQSRLDGGQVHIQQKQVAQQRLDIARGRRIVQARALLAQGDDRVAHDAPPGAVRQALPAERLPTGQGIV